jgi:hypothetical protein
MGFIGWPHSVIVDDVNLMRIAIAPEATEPPLGIDAYAPGAGAVAMQRLQPIAWRAPEELKRGGSVELRQLAFRGGAECPKTCWTPPREQRLGVLAAERPNNRLSLFRPA